MTVLIEQGIVGSIFYFSMIIWAGVKLIHLRYLARRLGSNALGFSNCAIGGALASILVAGQFADFLRLEITIWCVVLLVVIAKLSAKGVYELPDSAAVPGKKNTTKFFGNT